MSSKSRTIINNLEMNARLYLEYDDKVIYATVNNNHQPNYYRRDREGGECTVIKGHLKYGDYVDVEKGENIYECVFGKTGQLSTIKETPGTEVTVILHKVQFEEDP